MKNLILIAICVFLLNTTNLLAQTDWHLGGNTVSSSQRLGTNNSYSLIFETNGSDRGRITSGGNWGMGTADPTAKLHVNSTVSGQIPFRVQVLGSTKFLMHNNGGLAIGASTTPPTNGLFVSSNVGIGTTDLTVPGNSSGNAYKMKILHEAFGFVLENSISGNNWELYANDYSTNSPLDLFYNGNFKGSFNAATGAYSSVSDERLKTNIKVMPSILDKVNQLKPTTYQFKAANTITNEGNTSEAFGFLAQDVLKIFPQLVSHNVNKERGFDTYTLDYSSFGVLAIKGIQELQQTIQSQDTKIDNQQQIIQQLQQENNSFKERLTKLEAALQTSSNYKLNNTDEIGISLEQNTPNPVSSTTTFRYNIPREAKAQILLYNNTGKLIKNIEAPYGGQVQMEIFDIPAGNYIYTLVVDGKQVAAKQLVLSK